MRNSLIDGTAHAPGGGRGGGGGFAVQECHGVIVSISDAPRACQAAAFCFRDIERPTALHPCSAAPGAPTRGGGTRPGGAVFFFGFLGKTERFGRFGAYPLCERLARVRIGSSGSRYRKNPLTPFTHENAPPYRPHRPRAAARDRAQG